MPLTFVLFLAALLDLGIVGGVLQHGFSLSYSLTPAEGGGFYVPDEKEELREWVQFVVPIALVQVVILWLTVKAWRQPKMAHPQAK